MAKIIRSLLLFILIISVITVTTGCKNDKTSTDKNEESSITTDSIQTSLITNNSSKEESASQTSSSQASSSQASSSQTTASQISSSDYQVEEYHSRPDFSDYDTNNEISGIVPDVSSEVSSSSESSSSVVSNASQTKYAKKAVRDVLDLLKKGDFETAQSSITGECPPQESLGFDNKTIAKFKKILAELDYKVVSAKRTDSNEIIVTVKITALNFKKIYTSYINKASKIATNSPDLTLEQISQEIDKTFTKALKSGKKKPITETVKVTVVGHGKNWQVQYSTDFTKACLGGITQLSDVLN